MKAWFLNLNLRERVIVSVAAGLALLMLVYLLLIQPLATALEERRMRVEAQQELLQWMQTSAAEVQRLQASGRGRGQSGKAPYLLLDEAIRRENMPAPTRLEPQGKDGTVAQFESIGFDQLISVLARLQTETDLSLTELSVTRREQDMVSATLTLKRGGE